MVHTKTIGGTDVMGTYADNKIEHHPAFFDNIKWSLSKEMENTKELIEAADDHMRNLEAIEEALYEAIASREMLDSLE